MIRMSNLLRHGLIALDLNALTVQCFTRTAQCRATGLESSAVGGVRLVINGLAIFRLKTVLRAAFPRTAVDRAAGVEARLGWLCGGGLSGHAQDQSASGEVCIMIVAYFMELLPLVE